MSWIVQVSQDERNSGALTPATAERAHAALRESGCVLLRGAFPEPIVDSMYREFINRFGSLDAAAMETEAKRAAPNPVLRVGKDRYEIALEISGAFAAPEVLANPILLQLLAALLGQDMRLSGCTTVVSYPGSDLQHVHRDHPQLFPEQTIGPGLPVYAVNVSVPLINVDIETGPTAVWRGTHRMSDSTVRTPMEWAAITPFQRGDAILTDYRTLHAGLPNNSARIRPIFYLVYARTWFFDESNHTKRGSLNMPMSTYNSLPQSMQSLLLRAFRHEIAQR